MTNFSHSKSLVKVASAIAIGVGCLTLISWKFDVAIFKSIIPGTATMKADTALAFILAGVSLLIRNGRLAPSSAPTRLPITSLLSQICAAAVALIGLITLCQYIFYWMGIDELLFRSPKSIAPPFPSRMAENTALNFLLLGIALWLLERKETRKISKQKDNSILIAQSLSLTAAAIALLASIGHAYKVEVFYTFVVYSTSMTLITALTFLVFCTGILFVYPKRGFMAVVTSELNGGIVARRFIPSAIAVPLILGWLILLGYRAKLYDTAFAIALLVLLLIVIYIGLIWGSAVFLNRVDRDRQDSEASLRESEERFRRAILNAPFPIIIHAEDGEVVQISQAWTEITGYTHDEIPTIASWTEKAYREAKDVVKAGIDRLYELDGRLEEGEYLITTKHGERRTWDFSSAPLGRLADGRRLVMSMAADVTERKLAENALRQSEARLRLFVESDLIGILYGDVYGGISYANDAFLNIIGYTRADLEIGKINWTDITPPEYLPLDKRRIAEAQARGTCTPYEKEYIRKDGVRVFVIVGYALLKENREQSVAFILDISDRKRAEIERDRFFSLSLDMLCISGMDGYFKRLNPAFEKVLGFTQAEILQTPFLDLIHPEDRAKTIAEVEKLSTGAVTINLENRYLCKDGSYKWLVWSAVPEVELRLMYGVAHDITKRKRLEQKLRKQAEVLRKLNETLEERVQQRTAQLEAANKELESFSYSVSHDLRAPLRHIAGFIDLLQKRLKSTTTLDETSQRYLNIIIETTQLAGKLIDDLLSFSRMGRMEMHCTTIDMNLLVQEVLQDLELETKDRQISWQINTLLTVQGDPAMLRLVLRNLVENALKYSKFKPLTEITIGCQISSQAQEVVFFIRDNGIGFDMQYVHKLFGVFQRLHSDPNFQGTGVGLANVQRIIHRHGGQVWAEGELDKGATFYFSLPRMGVRGGE